MKYEVIWTYGRYFWNAEKKEAVAMPLFILP
jgi:hypothetical protein